MTHDADDTERVTAAEIKPGDLVDLTSSRPFRSHPSAEYTYAEVLQVEPEDNRILIGYESVGIGVYDPDEVLTIKARHTFPPDYFDKWPDVPQIP